ncbi:MAG: hypothetical protein K2K53_08265, partial [Oscillospiraceae bacterium]|nr:hypothetical protein [Oscillospiraceae bacterium]
MADKEKCHFRMDKSAQGNQVKVIQDVVYHVQIICSIPKDIGQHNISHIIFAEVIPGLLQKIARLDIVETKTDNNPQDCFFAQRVGRVPYAGKLLPGHTDCVVKVGVSLIT